MVQTISVSVVFLCLSLNFVASSKNLAEENSLINDISKEIAEAAANTGVVLAGKWDKKETKDEKSVNKFLDEVVKVSSKKIEANVKKLAATRENKNKVEDTPLFSVIMKLSGSHLKRLTIQRANSLTKDTKFVGTVNYSDEMKENNLLEALSNSLSNEYEKELKNKSPNKNNKVKSLGSNKSEGKTFDTNLANLVAIEENTKGRGGNMSDLATRSIEHNAFLVAKKMSRQVIKKYTHTTTKTVTSSSGESRSISDSKSISMPTGSEIGSDLQGRNFFGITSNENLKDYGIMQNREIGNTGVGGQFGQRSQNAHVYTSEYEKALSSGFSTGSSSSNYMVNGNSQNGYPCVYCPRGESGFGFDSNVNRGVDDFNGVYNTGAGREGGYYNRVSSKQQSSSSKKHVSDSSSSQSSSSSGYSRYGDSGSINGMPLIGVETSNLYNTGTYGNTGVGSYGNYKDGNFGGNNIYSSSSYQSAKKSSGDSKSSMGSSSSSYNYGTGGMNNIYDSNPVQYDVNQVGTSNFGGIGNTGFGGYNSNTGSQYRKAASSSSKKAASSSSSSSSSYQSAMSDKKSSGDFRSSLGSSSSNYNYGTGGMNNINERNPVYYDVNQVGTSNFGGIGNTGFGGYSSNTGSQYRKAASSSSKKAASSSSSSSSSSSGSSKRYGSNSYNGLQALY